MSAWKSRFLRMIWRSKCLPPLNDLATKDIRNSPVNTRMILLGQTANANRIVILVEDFRALAKIWTLPELEAREAYLTTNAVGPIFELWASAKYHFRFPQRRSTLASDVSVMGRTQNNFVVLWDVENNLGKRGIPLGIPSNFKGLDWKV